MATRHVPIKPYLANSTTSTASGAAICLSIEPNWCAQLYSVETEGNKCTAQFILGKSVVIICLKHAERQRPGRKVKGVEEVGVFLFSC